MIDLGAFSKDNHVVRPKEAIIWTVVWVIFALGFYTFLKFGGNYLHSISNKHELGLLISKFEHPINIDKLSYEQAVQLYRNNLALEFFSGYIIEYALSVDNIFVIIMIFMAFGVEKRYYKRVLFWGILGAVIMRFVFIFLSSALIQRFEWILYFFGALLLFTGVKMFITRDKEEKIDTEKHFIVRFVSRFFSVHPKFEGHHFWIRKNGKLLVTPLLIVLFVVEFSDVIFAVDSVPAIFAVTKDPYIVFFSNIFAILGLRSLFFLIMSVINIFHYLKLGLAFLLTFIGVKMIFHTQMKEWGIGTKESLIIILIILGTSIIASIIFPKKEIALKK